MAMKNERFKAMYEEYKKGYSLEQVGAMFGISRQSVYAGFKCRGYEMRKIKPLPYQFFNGHKYTLRNTGYYAKTLGDRSSMHRDVWESVNGKIPEGYDIHHINHNKSDNRIENLELYTKAEHARKFATGRNQHSKKSLNE